MIEKGSVVLILLGLASLLILIVLGLFVMIKGKDKALSNSLMRWRVLTQGAVFLLFTLFLLLQGK